MVLLGLVIAALLPDGAKHKTGIANRNQLATAAGTTRWCRVTRTGRVRPLHCFQEPGTIMAVPNRCDIHIGLACMPARFLFH